MSPGNYYSVGDKITANQTGKGHSFSAIVNSVLSTGNYLSVPQSADLQLETGDFTFEVWIFRQRTHIEEILCSTQPLNQDKGWVVGIDSKNYLTFEFPGTKKAISNQKLETRKWYHVCVQRSGNTLTLFINGKKRSSTTWNDGTVSSNNVSIGRYDVITFQGFMNDLRITKDVARYSKDFTPQITPYSLSEDYYNDVSLLIRMNGAHNTTIFTDLSSTPKTITTNGSVLLSKKESRFGSTSGWFSGLGPITSIYIQSPGFDYDTIPTFTINSQRGVGAVIEDTGQTIGKIKKIEFTDPFVDCVTALVSVQSTNGQGAVLSPKYVSLFNEKPSLKTYEGVLGVNCTLLDSYYYQQFSYEIHSEISRDVYDSIVDEWCHPSGFIRFAVLDIYYSEPLISLQGPAQSIDISVIKVVYGVDLSQIINPIYNLDWFKEISNRPYSGYNGGFDWITANWTDNPEYYMSQALEIFPIIKNYEPENKDLIINASYNLDWFKESIDNFAYVIEDLGDPSLNDLPVYGLERVKDNSNYLSLALDAEIEIV